MWGSQLSEKLKALPLPTIPLAYCSGRQRPRRHLSGARLTQKALMGGRSAVEVLSLLLLRAALGRRRAPP